jgi:hypothetical protein
MTITLNGSTGITNDGGYTGDGVSFADTTPSNTLVTTTGGKVGIGTSSPSAKLQSIDAVQPFIAGLTNGNFIFREFGSTAANNTLELNVRANSGKSGYVTFTEDAVSDRWSVGIQNGVDALRFISGTPTSGTERMRIDSSGQIFQSCTGLDGDRPNAAGGTVKQTNGNTKIRVSADNSAAFQFYSVTGGGSPVGSIAPTASGTNYNTSSDYRLKENIAPMMGALAKVSALKPVTYTWKSTGEESQGFIAHELAAVVPDCVTGEKDAVDAEGNPQYQGIDTSFLVATLTAAIQEQQAIITEQANAITALEARLTALEQA